MAINDFFDRIAKRMESAGLASKTIGTDDGSAINQLLVYLHSDSRNMDYVLQLIFLNDAARAAGAQFDEDTPVNLQLFISFPFLVGPGFETETGMLLHALNRILPIGGFGLSEDDRVLYYRYNLTSAGDGPPDDVVEEAIGMISFFLSAMAEGIHDVAKNVRQRRAVVADLTVNKGLVFPPMEPLPGAA